MKMLVGRKEYKSWRFEKNQFYDLWRTNVILLEDLEKENRVG